MAISSVAGVIGRRNETRVGRTLSNCRTTSMLKNIIIILSIVENILLFHIILDSPPIIPATVVKTIHDNKIIVSVLVEKELQDIFAEIEAGGYHLTDVKTLRPVQKGVFSWHNYGLAVDVNPTENPCLGVGCTDEISARYKGQWIAGKNGALTKEIVQSFKKRGWCWGGDWCGKKDYMHFSKPIGLPNQDECKIAKCPYFITK